MKIEGMQYQIPTRPAGQRHASQDSDIIATDDAVYFEPDERRQKEQHQHAQDQNEKQKTLEDQVSAEKLMSDKTPERSEGSESSESRPPLNIIV